MTRYAQPLDKRYASEIAKLITRVRKLETRTAGIDSGMPLAALPAVIPDDYTTGLPSVYVNGSASLTGPCLYATSYTPVAGDQVLVVPLPVTAGLGQGVYLITGKVHLGKPASVVGGQTSTLIYDAPPNPLPVDVLQAQQVELQNVTSATVALNPTQPGSCLVVVVVTANATTNATVDTVEADNLADNFGSLYTVGSTTGGAGALISFWADPDCAGGQTSVEVTTEDGVGASQLSVFVIEAQGLATTISGLLDQFDGNPSGGPSASWSSGSTAATTQANELWVGAAGSYQLSNGMTGPDTPWTSALNESSNPAMAGYQVAAAEGEATYAGSLATSAAWTAAVITLKPATPGSLLASLASAAFTDALGNEIPLGAGINAGQVLTSLLNGTVPATQIIEAGSIEQAQLSASITARTLGGITSTISSTAPASPSTGDIWIDEANGNQLNQWSGTAWVPITFTGTDVLSAASITVGLLGAGAVEAGNVAAGAIQAGNLQAGAVIAGDIAAQSITASNLVVSYDGQVQQDSPIGWWKLDDPTGSGTVQDYSGGGHPGTATNITFQQAQAVAAVPSASFNGTSSKVATTWQPAALSEISIECWLNLDGLTQSTWAELVNSSHSDVSNLGFDVYYTTSGGTVTCSLGNGTTHADATHAVPSTGFAHIVYTYDGTTLRMYLNGAQVATSPLTGSVAADTSNHVWLGESVGGSNWLNGLLSEVAIYNTALSAGRVAAHYAAKTGAIVAANIASDTITADQIAAQTIGADLLVAGLVVAGIVDGTLIEGAQFVAYGTTGEILVYSGTPAANNLIASVSGAQSTDDEGNEYLQGSTWYTDDSGTYLALNIFGNELAWYSAASEAGPWVATGANMNVGTAGAMALVGKTLELVSTSGTPITVSPGSGFTEFTGAVMLANQSAPGPNANNATLFAGSGALKVVDAADGNTYDTQVLHQDLAGVTISAVTPSFTSIGPAVSVAAQQYKVHVRGFYSGASAGTPRFSFSAPAFAAGSIITAIFQPNGSASGAGGANSGTIGPVAGPTMASVSVVVDIWIEATFTASGTLQFEANTSASGDSFSWTLGHMEVYTV